MNQSRSMGSTASAPHGPGGELERIFPGNSEMARRMRSFDWSKNPLGPPERWPQNLKTCVRITLTSRHPMFVWWGERLIHLYNDGYAAFLHTKHPMELGLPAPTVWQEVWPVVGPRVEFAMHRSEGTYDEALMLILLRKGFPEEMYVTFSYSPIPDDNGDFGGILCPATEETERIIGERQMALLRELGARTADARTYKDATELASSALQTNPADLPFALIYLVDPEKRSASLAEATGISRGDQRGPRDGGSRRAVFVAARRGLAHTPRVSGTGPRGRSEGAPRRARLPRDPGPRELLRRRRTCGGFSRHAHDGLLPLAAIERELKGRVDVRRSIWLDDEAVRHRGPRLRERLLVRVGGGVHDRNAELRPERLSGFRSPHLARELDVHQDDIRRSGRREVERLLARRDGSDDPVAEIGQLAFEVQRHDPFVLDDEDVGLRRTCGGFSRHAHDGLGDGPHS